MHYCTDSGIEVIELWFVRQLICYFSASLFLKSSLFSIMFSKFLVPDENLNEEGFIELLCKICGNTD